MTAPKIRLTEPPTLYRPMPQCGACMETVTEDSGEGYDCPQCGTFWPWSAGEDDPGTTYAEEHGENVDHLPLVETEDAWLWQEGRS